ncbi:hypothetical protein [Paenibacillus polymyxa]|uniref:hypothetical protein n=1 Tax=Paenibacillus polymyxa TaxID=1406 RepID=UPI00202495D8|nr:hypothetical protein [Paenibacillus polymyxa]WDZ55118.1 hypothetical protein MF622_10295 [Paenibacillus polymyxa]
MSEQSRISKLFATLQIRKALRNADISKSFVFFGPHGVPNHFSLVFEVENWLRLLDSERGTVIPRKDVVYRFLNQTSFTWRRFLQNLSLRIVLHFDSLLSSTRVRVFIDDSVLSGNRGKKAELLARYSTTP